MNDKKEKNNTVKTNFDNINENSIYGIQHFKKDKDNTKPIIYQFSTQEDFNNWIFSDIQKYQDLKENELKFTRQKIEPDQIKKEYPNEQIKNFKPYKQLKEEKDESYLRIKHPSMEKVKDFGVVLKFKNVKERSEFMKDYNNVFSNNMIPLDKKDERVIAGKFNNLIMNYNTNKKDQSITKVFQALKNYPKIDPTKNYFAMVAQKNMSKPEIYSFPSKIDRDFFIKKTKINSNKKLPIHVGQVSNYNSIVLSFASNEKILSGNFKQNFQRFNDYMIRNNSKDIKNKEEVNKLMKKDTFRLQEKSKNTSEEKDKKMNKEISLI